MRVAEQLLPLRAPFRGSAAAGRAAAADRRCRPGCPRSHSPYGCAGASSRLISSSETIRPRAVSTRKMRPGCSRSLSTMSSAGMSSTPTSDAMITRSSLRDVVARRPQAVAVEHGADDRAVGEGDRRRAVPRLHQRRVVFVERLQRRAIASCPAHGSGIIIRMRVRQRAAGHDQELEHVVERRRVAAALADDRQDLLQVVAEGAATRAGLRAPASS